MKKVLIFGISGMAGHMIYYHLSKKSNYKVFGTARGKTVFDNTISLDVANFRDVENLIQQVNPDIIVNAIGVLIKGSRSDSSNAILINSYFPHFLEKLCRKQSCRLVHISTDCVFSGNDGMYKEASFRDADDVYGRSKTLGEINNDIDITIRTSIIGPELKDEGEGLFHWFMSQSGTINGFENVYWGGVTTLELAYNIDSIIQKEITGIFQLTNGKKISKYDLLQLFKNIWGKDDVKINKTKSTPKDKSLVNTRKSEHELSKTYKTMLLELKEFMRENHILFEYTQRYH